MRCQTKGQRAQYKCCTDRSRQGETVKNEQPCSMPAYPTKKSPRQVSPWFTWQKHGSPLHLLAVDLPIACLDSTLFAACENVIKPEHIDVNNKQDETRQNEKKTKAGYGKK